MYFEQARKKKAILWEPHPNQQVEKVALAVDKYRARGYTFSKPQDEGPHIRTFANNQAYIIDYGSMYRGSQHHHLPVRVTYVSNVTRKRACTAIGQV